MSQLTNHINELRAAEAFTKQARIFDRLYRSDAIIQYKRQRVREHMLQILRPGSNLLELNSGTGDDALFFAGEGFHIHATDISEGMLSVLQEKLKDAGCEDRVSTEQCSFTELDFLQNKGPFDAIYSNFGGLNCTGDLDKVLLSVNALLKPGGTATLVIISPFCLWETLLLFRGKFKTAFRRFFSARGRKAHIEGSFFKCWYYSSSFIIKRLRRDFELIGLEGLCTIVPPSYMEHFGEKHPKLFAFLRGKENKLKSTLPWRNMGDYYIISLRKKFS
jgi:ubiquinone/menaquinone biosynthesis C-methylase UbiE